MSDAQPTEGTGDRIDSFVTSTVEALIRERRAPESTYRLQFHAGFQFRAAAEITPYLHELGITDCYASPYLKARPGTKHGYDISDHRVLNPEIGTDADYEAWVQVLHSLGMGQLLDTVPNHMGIVGNENAWWNDVLENGPSSPYSGYFDIDWHSVKPELHGKVLLGILGDPYGKVLEAGHVALKYEPGAFVIHYFDHRFPVAPESALLVLRLRVEELEQSTGKDAPDFMEYQSILTALGHLPLRTETDLRKIGERQREKEVIKRRLQNLTETSVAVRDFIDQNVTLFNGNPSNPHSFDLLDHLLNDQSYRLAHWQVASDEINYRRFFDVNELAALSMEKKEVFDAAHGLILKLLGERKVTGLRIDHPDGLFDPRQYLERLQQEYVVEEVKRRHKADLTDADFTNVQTIVRNRLAARDPRDRQPLYVVVEKILGRDEPIPEDWAADGTSGYEFLNMLNGLFVNPAHERFLSRSYQRLTGMDPDLRSYVQDKKFLILQVALASELHMLAHQLDRLSEKNRWSRDFTFNSLRHTLREIIACFPVYRSYITDKVVPRDQEYVEYAVRQAKRRNPAISGSIFDFVRDMVLLRFAASASEADRAEQQRFVGKFQQVTSPVMAKGLEDTTFYVYNRMIALNEVGGDPGRFGVKPADLHAFFAERQERWPYALSATSTHDTKRSEDVRARLDVLSEVPKEWHKAVSHWKRWNKRHYVHLESGDAPDSNDEYLLYQTLIGAWPLDGAIGTEFVERIRQYMAKAVHEAKVNSSWINPNKAYDDATNRFVTRILDPKLSQRFLEDFRPFQARVSHVGLFNSLSQTLLKIAAPGVPDFYQGTELWDFSLVDPDNRRPVDFGCRQEMLQGLKTSIATGAPLAVLAHGLVENKEDGRVKLFVTHRGLECRRENRGLFTRGHYVEASASGPRADHLFGFIRRLQDQWAMAVVPRLLAEMIFASGAMPLGVETWKDTMLIFPGLRPGDHCKNLFTGEIHELREQDGQTILQAADVFSHFPVALLMGTKPS